MSGRLPLILAALLLAAGPAVFADSMAAAAEKPSAVVGQYIDLQPVALPIVANGQLVNYVFAYVRINLTGGSDVSKLRDKEPYFRDALVRDGHRTPFVVAGTWQKIDEARLAAALMRDAPAIVGAGVVSSVVVTSQAPQRAVMPPKSVQVGPS